MASEERIREIIKAIQDAVVGYDDEACERLCKSALEEGIDPHRAVMEGLTGGMEIVGELYNKQEYFVPELLLCADALNAGLNVFKPHLKIESVSDKGKLLLGVVEGDIHDIGKNLVKIMFEAAGWDVYDLGNNVAIVKFAEEQPEGQRRCCRPVGIDDNKHARHAQDYRGAQGSKPRRESFSWRRPLITGDCEKVRR